MLLRMARNEIKCTLSAAVQNAVNATQTSIMSTNGVSVGKKSRKGFRAKGSNVK